MLFDFFPDRFHFLFHVTVCLLIVSYDKVCQEGAYEWGEMKVSTQKDPHEGIAQHSKKNTAQEER